jgi:pimeloyl-ACP methyl ester carboxylesterase
LLALATADPGRCSAVVALAPPVRAAVTDHYRRILARGGRWFRRRLRPPASVSEQGEDAGVSFHDESARVAREILSDETALAPCPLPVLVIGGTRDQLVDPARLREFAERRGYAYAERDAGHWGLGGAGFERQVDPMHRWLVKQVGTGLLRLSGYEDVDDEDG